MIVRDTQAEKKQLDDQVKALRITLQSFRVSGAGTREVRMAEILLEKVNDYATRSIGAEVKK